MRIISLVLVLCVLPAHLRAKEVSLNANFLKNCIFRNFKADVGTKLTIRNHNTMETLSFDRSTIYRIPQQAFSTGRLKNFTAPMASINLIEKSTFTNAVSLLYLNLTANALEEVKDGTFELAPVLSRLDLSYNRINVVGGNAFNGLKELLVLSISHNVIQEIKEETFKPLVKLEILYLDHNKLKVLQPGTLVNNIVLRTFYVEKNEITELPPTFFDKQKNVLENLDLSDNSGIRIELKGFTKLDDVRVGHVALQTLEMLPTMTVLIADHCEISEVVGSDLGSLMYAKLSHNNISDLSWIVNATKLYSLHLSFNRIETIGTMLNNLIELKYLYIDNVGLKSIGYADFSFQKNLKILDIGYNGLGDIDFDKFVSMPSMEVLYLDGNNLEEIPYHEIIHIFPKLKTLGLSNNEWLCQYLALYVKVFNKHTISLHVDQERNLGNKTTLAGMGCYEKRPQKQDRSEWSDYPSHSQENEESGESNDTVLPNIVEAAVEMVHTFQLLYENDKLKIEIKKKEPNVDGHTSAARVSNSEDSDMISRLRSINRSVSVSTTILILAMVVSILYAGYVMVQFYLDKKSTGYPIHFNSSTNLISQGI